MTLTLGLWPVGIPHLAILRENTKSGITPLRIDALRCWSCVADFNLSDFVLRVLTKRESNLFCGFFSRIIHWKSRGKGYLQRVGATFHTFDSAFARLAVVRPVGFAALSRTRSSNGD